MSGPQWVDSTRRLKRRLLSGREDNLLTKSEGGTGLRGQRKGMDFSSGERQLIFARAIVFNPKNFNFRWSDSIDTGDGRDYSKTRLMSLKEDVRNLRRLRTACQRCSCDQIFVLIEGKLWKRGTHDELMQLQGQYAEMVWQFQKANGLGTHFFWKRESLMPENRFFIVFQGNSWRINPPSLIQCVGNSLRRDSYDYKRNYWKATAHVRHLHMYPEVSERKSKRLRYIRQA